MPFISKAQRRFLYSKHPDIAQQWEKETGNKPLPERVGKTRGQKSESKLKRGMSGKSR